MNKGVEILLERMESNPNEFAYDDPLLARKWRDITEQISQRYQAIIKNPDVKNHWQYALDFLEDEEIITLHNKLKALRAEEFTKDVMGRLLAGADDGNYHTFAQAQSVAPKTNQQLTSQKQAEYMQAEYAYQHQMAEAQAEIDNVVSQQTKRAFGKGK
jgi:hypothetical protein